MNKLIYLTAGIILTFSCSRCKEECTDSTNPECPNYEAPADPCAGKTEVNADFIIQQEIGSAGNFFQLLNTDTALSEVNLTMVSSVYENAEYTWIIGLDTVHAPTASFWFQDNQAGQSFPVKLIVEANPDTICFPNDNGRDTVTKYVHVIDRCDNPIFGDYKVAFDSNPTDSIVVGIHGWGGIDDPLGDCYNVYIINFNNPPQTDSCRISVRGGGYKYLKFWSNDSSCSGSRGEAIIGADGNSITATYQYWDQSLGIPLSPDTNWPYRTFRGRRIH